MNTVQDFSHQPIPLTLDSPGSDHSCTVAIDHRREASPFDAFSFDDLSIILPTEKVEEIRSHILSHLTPILPQLTTVGKASIGSKEWKCKLRLQPNLESYVRLFFTQTNGTTIEQMVYLSGGPRGVFMYKKPIGKCESKDFLRKRTKHWTMFNEFRLSQNLGSSPYVLQEEPVMRRTNSGFIKGFKAPWCLGGDLGGFIDFEAQHHLVQTTDLHHEKLKISSQIAAGLAYLHEHGYVHGDINPTNIGLQITQEGVVAKVFDFDRTIPSSSVLMHPIITREYTPPEAWQVQRLINPKDDIWGLGLTLAELLDGKKMNLFLKPKNGGFDSSAFYDPKNYQCIREKWIELHDRIIKNTKDRGVLCPYIYTLIELDPSIRPEARVVAARLDEEYRSASSR